MFRDMILVLKSLILSVTTKANQDAKFSPPNPFTCADFT